MVAARVETPHIEIPMIICEHQHIRFDKLALAQTKSTHQSLVDRQPCFFETQRFGRMLC
jgi:hypothetical protein